MWHLKGDYKLLQITTEFIEKFNGLNSKCADVYIKHILYGSQKIKQCVLHTLLDGERIGLIINDEEKYITMEELRRFDIDSKECSVSSDVMELYIKL